jgi:hypothetical protein
MKRRRPMVLVTLALVLASSLAGCGDDGGEAADGATTSTSTSSSTSSTTEDREAAERQAVVDAYNAAADAAIAASAPPAPNPDDPDLLATHTGPMLEQRQGVFRGLRANGWAIQYPEDSRYRVEIESVAFEGDDVAILDVCGVDDGERVVVETGEVLAGGVWTVQATAAMRRVDDMWKLAERREENRWEGEAGCAPR